MTENHYEAIITLEDGKVGYDCTICDKKFKKGEQLAFIEDEEESTWMYHLHCFYQSRKKELKELENKIRTMTNNKIKGSKKLEQLRKKYNDLLVEGNL